MGNPHPPTTKLLLLIFAGALDKYPGVQLIANHWGEVILFYAERIAMIDHLGTRLARPFEDYLRDNVSYTGSGIMSQRYLRWTTSTGKDSPPTSAEQRVAAVLPLLRLTAVFRNVASPKVKQYDP